MPRSKTTSKKTSKSVSKKKGGAKTTRKKVQIGGDMNDNAGILSNEVIKAKDDIKTVGQHLMLEREKIKKLTTNMTMLYGEIDKLKKEMQNKVNNEEMNYYTTKIEGKMLKPAEMNTRVMEAMANQMVSMQGSINKFENYNIQEIWPAINRLIKKTGRLETLLEGANN